MDPSFEELYESGVFGGTPCPTNTNKQSSQRPKFLSAITGLVSRSVKRPLSTSYRPPQEQSSPSRLSTAESRYSSRSTISLPVSPPSSGAPPPTWKLRGQIPDMDDYLSMSQLENVWNYQDSHVGPIVAPLTAKNYSFHEIAEAPTFVKRKRQSHQTLDESDMSSDDAGSVENASADGSAAVDAAIVVDGVMHPALRPTPYLENQNRQRHLPTLPRLQIPGT